jgi:hypothetical protein
MMNSQFLLDHRSQPSPVSATDFFSVPPTQTAVKKSFWSEINPVNAVNSQGPYTFISQKDGYFTEISHAYMYLRVAVLNIDGTPTTHANDVNLVTPANMLGKSFIKQLKFYLNGALATDSSDTYAYQHYITNLLSYGEEHKKNQLYASGYVKSQPPARVGTAEDLGFQARFSESKGSRDIEICTKVRSIGSRLRLRLRLMLVSATLTCFG